MAPRRPVPLSDEIFVTSTSTAPSIGHLTAGPVLLGSKNRGMLAQAKYVDVKHALLEASSGVTPARMIRPGLMPMQFSAPAELSRSPGFIQRAIAASIQSPSVPSGIEATLISPASRLHATSTPPRSAGSASFQYTPMQTPTPTAVGQMFHGGRLFASPPQRGYGGGVVNPCAGLNPEQLEPSIENSRVAGYASLFSGPLTFALDPSSARASGLKERLTPPGRQQRPLESHEPAVWEPRSVVTLVQQDKPEHAGAVEDDDKDDQNESDSEDEMVIASPRLRNPSVAPRPPAGALHPSMGSESHASGACKRCCFFPRGRCANGYECEFCHYDHDKRKRKSKKKTKTVRGGDMVLASLFRCTESSVASCAKLGQIALAHGLVRHSNQSAAHSLSLEAGLEEKPRPVVAPTYVDSCTVTATCVNYPASVQQPFVTPCYYGSYGNGVPTMSQPTQPMFTYNGPPACNSMPSLMQTPWVQQGFEQALPPPPMQSPKFPQVSDAVTRVGQHEPPMASPKLSSCQ